METRKFRLAALAATAALAIFATSAFAAEQVTAEKLLPRIGVSRGVCALVGDKDCGLAIDLTKKSDLLLYVQLPTAEDCAAACKAADAAGFYGSRIFVEQGTPARIGLADNLANAVVVLGDPPGLSKPEILRVLCPEGKALIGQGEWTKPLPEGTDDWSHHFHGPDNNPQSRDRLARAPYLTQFIVEPRYAPAPQASVASGGRVFMAFGHVAWHEREEPWMNTLVAIDAYNGTMLWRRPLTPGLMVDRCTLIATPSVLYLADDKSCKLFDAATGQLKDEIIVPRDLAGGTFWKWIALTPSPSPSGRGEGEGGVLYALVGEDEKPDPDARWRRTAHGWPWNEMSQGYNDPKRLWGFGKTLLAIDPQTKKVLWTHQEDLPIDSRALCMAAGRIYCFHFGQYLTCLDAKTGDEVWRRTAEKSPEVFRAIGRYRPDQGPIQGWKTNNYMKCTDKALYFAGPEVQWLTALSAEDGHVLFRHPVKDLHIVIRDDGLYTIGPANSVEETQKLNPLTGEVLAKYATKRRSCTRATGSADSIFFRGFEGSGRFDVASGKTAWISAMRPSCQVGVLVAHGHLYWVPWACDCNLQMFGAICCGPAGDFAFDQKANDAERLQTTGLPPSPSPLVPSPLDWPTYRANNTRTAQTPAAIPAKVRLLWRFTPPREVEPTAPVAVADLVFTGGDDGIVRALDASSGAPRWTAYTGGAVKYPPTIADGRALVGSGDGWVHAMEAATGRILWQFRAAPAERKIRFYDRLLSTWPVASGVLADKGTAYCAAGISDFDGTHVYALDAATGRIRWQNNAAGHLDGFSLRGVACQGEMLLRDGQLYLAGGNTVSPGVFDAATGQCLNTPPNSMGGTAPRGRELTLANGQVKVTGQPLYSRPETPVFDPAIAWQNPVVTAANARVSCVQARPRMGRPWTLVAQSLQDKTTLWEQPLSAEPVRWGVAVNAQGLVLVALRNGQVLCFGK
jgi:outer membrane protein assembly factor BamB